MTDESVAVKTAAAVGMTRGKSIQAIGHWEPSLSVQFLPRCGACGDKHPLAYDPAEPEETCPSCGASHAGIPPAMEVPAVLTIGRPAAAVANLMLSIGRFLSRVGKGT